MGSLLSESWPRECRDIDRERRWSSLIVSLADLVVELDAPRSAADMNYGMRVWPSHTVWLCDVETRSVESTSGWSALMCQYLT